MNTSLQSLQALLTKNFALPEDIELRKTDPRGVDYGTLIARPTPDGAVTVAHTLNGTVTSRVIFPTAADLLAFPYL